MTWSPVSLLLLLKEDSGQVQVTKLPQPRFQWEFPEQKQKGSHLSEFFGDFQATQLIQTVFPRRIPPWLGQHQEEFSSPLQQPKRERLIKQTELGLEKFPVIFPDFHLWEVPQLETQISDLTRCLIQKGL